MIPWISRLATVRRESFWGHIGYVSCHKIAEEEKPSGPPSTYSSTPSESHFSASTLLSGSQFWIFSDPTPQIE